MANGQLTSGKVPIRAFASATSELVPAVKPFLTPLSDLGGVYRAGFS
jgi:hypothetical protein